MNKTEHNFWLDVTIFVALLITTITGFLLWLVIPHKLDIVFLGFSRSVWVAAHICFGVVGLAGIVIHIVRHWGWLKALRGRPLSGMPEKLRANRVVDRIMWITFIATNVFGAIAWVLHFGDDIYHREGSRSPACRVWSSVHNPYDCASCIALEVDCIYCQTLYTCRLQEVPTTFKDKKVTRMAHAYKR